jgi:hypothetical protein
MSDQTHAYMVVLHIRVDGPAPWWKAMGLPNPDRWSDELHFKTWAKVVSQHEITRGDA